MASTVTELLRRRFFGKKENNDPWKIGEVRTQDDFTWYNNRLVGLNNNNPTATPPYTVFSTHYRACDLVDIEGSKSFYFSSLETNDTYYNCWRDAGGNYISAFYRTTGIKNVPANAKYMQLSQGKDSGRDLNFTFERIT